MSIVGARHATDRNLSTVVEAIEVFFDLDQFARAVLERSPTIALITWNRRSALTSFVRGSDRALRDERQHRDVVKIDAAKLDRQSFARKLIEAITRANAGDICLLIYNIDSFASGAGKILNGFRDGLGNFRAVVIAIHESRRRDFYLECPDLLDWIGPMIGRAEQLGAPLSLSNVKKAIKSLEGRHRMKSKEFIEKRERGEAPGLADEWEWLELLAIKTDLEASLK